jgi:hypothetical protein
MKKADEILSASAYTDVLTKRQAQDKESSAVQSSIPSWYQVPIL